MFDFSKRVKTPPKNAPWLKLMTNGAFPIGNEKEFNYSSQQIPLPNYTLRQTVSRPDLGGFYFIGESWALAVLNLMATIENPRYTVLDLGCGVGKTARFLALDTRVRYVGFDIFKPAIDWANNAFKSPVGERFRFEHFDGLSEFYNPEGKISPQDYEFPVEDGSVDVAFAASLFTHLREDDMRAYLLQTAIKLTPDGLALYSIKEASPDAPEDMSGTEQSVVIKRSFFTKIANECGLALQSDGHMIGGQRAIVLKRATS